MRRQRLLAFALLMAAVAWCLPALAWSMRCGGQLVGAGDSQYDVLSKCGQPAYRDRDVQYLLLGDVRLQQQTIWYYDRGTNRFIDVLHFRDGILSRITSAGYGFGDASSQKCNSNQILVGMTDYELLRTCGPPQARRSVVSVLIPADSAPEGTYLVVRVEQWQYNFGANQFPRTVTIRKGVVRHVRTGSQL